MCSSDTDEWKKTIQQLWYWDTTVVNGIKGLILVFNYNNAIRSTKSIVRALRAVVSAIASSTASFPDCQLLLRHVFVSLDVLLGSDRPYTWIILNFHTVLRSNRCYSSSSLFGWNRLVKEKRITRIKNDYILCSTRVYNWLERGHIRN